MTSKSNDKTVTIKEFRDAYKAADELNRECANFGDDVLIPANNELKYAGYHFLDSIGDDGSLVNGDELKRAVGHCHRAMYESADAMLIKSLRDIKQFQTDYSRTLLIDLVPCYLTILKDANEAQSVSAKKRRHNEGPMIVNDEYLALCRKMRDHCHSLDLVRPELNKKMKQEDKKTRTAVISICVMIFGIVISLITALHLIAN